ncbi:MAG: indole-3-glycerol phosphate synthase TrpC [Terriglobales bacterium]
MQVTLNEIVAATRLQVEQRKREVSVRQLEAQAGKHVPRGFRAALERKARSGIAVIAEIKKASPSRGVIRSTVHVAHIAQSYERHGAAALSVLTEEQFFLGSLANLVEASAATQLPCLRKDFIVEEYQLIEALAHRADAVLLIASLLEFEELAALHRRARNLGLDVLCEVHDGAELKRALAVPAQIIGVNNRDLRTFEVDLNTAVRLAAQIPPGVLKVAESGIRTGEDISRLRAAGYQAFLVGESLMKANDPGAALGELLGSRAQAKTL